jgi:hypothetical protein
MLNLSNKKNPILNYDYSKNQCLSIPKQQINMWTDITANLKEIEKISKNYYLILSNDDSDQNTVTKAKGKLQIAVEMVLRTSSNATMKSAIKVLVESAIKRGRENAENE